MNLPTKIYKYRTFNENSWQILTEQKIYFSSPGNFNDPKDCKIPILYELGTEKQMYYKNVEKLKDIYPNLNRKAIKNKASELAKLTFSRRDDKRILKEFRQALNETHNKVGIFSTSLINDNKLMWSHYADSQKGFCIEFDCEMLIKSLEEYLWVGIIPIFKEVSYTVKSPRLNPYKLTDEQLFISLYFTKSIEWSYEKEYRILINDKSNSLYDIKENTINSVILGAECLQENEDKMKEVLESIPYKIQLQRAVYDDLDFDMRFKDID